MNSKQYWAQREAEALKHRITDEKEYDKELKKIYANMLDACQSEINAFYGKYAAGEGISIAEAKKRVSELDIKAYERKAARYVKDREFSKQANEEMRLYNATMKINRLEMLKANIGLETIAGHDELEKFMASILKGRTEDELKRQAGILGKTVKNNAQTANAIVNGSFKNPKVGNQSTFSDRIWMYQDQMRNDLGKLLQSGLIQGKNPRALTKDLKKYWYGADAKTGGGALYCMERLMRTELARVQTEAQKQSYVENGVEEYRFLANSSCCEHCKALHDKRFKVDKMMPGENAPPLHPHCRCSTTEYVDRKSREEWLDYIEKGGAMSLAEWRKQKDKKQLTFSSKRDKIGQAKLANTKRRGILPPAMDEGKYNKMVKGLKANGVTTLVAKGDDLRYLEAIGAEASIMGTTHILHMGAIPSASAMYEEIIHNAQAKKYGVLADSDSIELYVREILANRLMLKNSKAYGFTAEDLEDVERNLSVWEKRYKERMGVDFDESGIDRKI